MPRFCIFESAFNRVFVNYRPQGSKPRLESLHVVFVQAYFEDVNFIITFLLPRGIIIYFFHVVVCPSLCLFVCLTVSMNKIIDFHKNFVSKCGMGQGRIDSILGRIRIWTWIHDHFFPLF